MRNHVGALTRFYLDAMLGLTPLRAHCAQRPLRREHDAVLREWAGSVLSLQRAAVLMDTFQLLVGFGFAVLLLGKSVIGPQAGAALLLMYWALKIPMLSQSLALSVRQLPSQINVALRVLEPLGARLDLADSEAAPGKAGADTGGHGIRVTFHAVKVQFKCPSRCACRDCRTLRSGKEFSGRPASRAPYARFGQGASERERTYTRNARGTATADRLD